MIRTRAVDVPGAQLVAEAIGDGPAVVLLHGFGGDRHIWEPLSEALAPRHRVVRYDLRGFGDSRDEERPPFRHARDLEAVLDAFDIADCALAGLSLGGDIQKARELWYGHPLFATTRAMPGAAKALRRSIASYSGVHWAEGDTEHPVLPDVDRLAGLEVPTLLLTGTEDLPDFRLIADMIGAAAPDVRRIDYAGAGHMLPLERAQELARDIAAFLA